MPQRGCLLMAGVVIAAGAAWGQSARPGFEVASVKLNTRCDAGGRSGGAAMPGRVVLECADLRDLILTAYGIYGAGANPASGSFRMQVTGGPAWMDSTRYDITAKPAGNPPRSEMYGPMMQSLLEERFRLKVHRESREGRVYFLTVAKNAPKLRATQEGSCVVADIDHPPEAGARVCGKQNIRADGTLDMYGATIANLCAQLGLAMDREVIDKTGLAGRFDIHLDVSLASLKPKFAAGRSVGQDDLSATDDTDTGPALPTALQQLGLKIESGKGPVQAIVVDHIEQLTEN